MAEWIDVTGSANWTPLVLSWETPTADGTTGRTCYPEDNTSQVTAGGGYAFSAGAWQGPALTRAHVVGTDGDDDPVDNYVLQALPLLRYSGPYAPEAILGVRVTARLRDALTVAASAINNQAVCMTPAGGIFGFGEINAVPVGAGSYPLGETFVGTALRDSFGDGPWNNIVYGWGEAGAQCFPWDVTAALIYFGSECTLPRVVNTAEWESSPSTGYYQCLDITKIEIFAEPMAGEFWTDFVGTMETD